MAHGPALNIAIAEKHFGGDGPALFSDFRLEVAPGSVVAVLGPSGIGKSTLLRLVAGIDRGFTGRITVDGVPAASAPPPGFVFQDPRLLPWLSASDNVRLADATMSREAAVAMLSRVGLGDRADAYPHQLSGGMQRRVALARALAVNARLLLLDEPFVSLDRALIDEMQQVAADLFEMEQPTTLMVSHEANDAARLADRVIVLAGRPARIVADLDLPDPRSARAPAQVAAYASRLLQAIGARGG